LFSFLDQPYPYPESTKAKLVNGFFIAAFVFIFLYLFQPFGLAAFPSDSLLLITAGYGLVTLVITYILQFAAPALFPKFFNDKRWSVGIEILWSLFHILLIGAGNLLYTDWITSIDINVSNLVFMLFATLMVGILPVSGIILLNNNRMMRKYINQAMLLNRDLQTHQHAHPQQQVKLIGQNDQEVITFLPEQLLMIASAENYIEVFWILDGKVKQQMIRSTLKDAEVLLNEYDFIVRCHRSYLVNLDQVRVITGNSQGLKLHLNYLDEPVPVSRSRVGKIRYHIEKGT
jgi:hypothetical protein